MVIPAPPDFLMSLLTSTARTVLIPAIIRTSTAKVFAACSEECCHKDGIVSTTVGLHALHVVVYAFIRKIKNFLKDLAALIRLNSDFKHVLS